MAKLTLLDMVQDILSDMDSDEVNSIDDTVESLQVAQIVRQTYYNIMAEQFFPMEAVLTALTPASDTDTPTHFSIPDNTDRISTIRYDIRASASDALRYTDMTYLSPEDFLTMVLGRDSTASNIQTVTDDTGRKLLIQNDKAPQFWTTFDDENIIFDSFNSSIDTTLQASKMICYAEISESFSLEDDFVAPNIPAKGFPYFLAEAKGMCFVNIKQQANPKIEQISRRLRNKLISEKFRVGDLITYPDYGRRSMK